MSKFKTIRISLFLFVINCLFITSIYSQSVSTTNLSLNAGDINNTVIVSVNTSNINSSYGGILFTTIRIEYNPDVLQYIDVVNMNPTLAAQTFTFMPAGAGGIVQLNLESAVFAVPFVYPDGKSYDIRFTYKGGNTDLTITNAEFIDAAWDSYYPSVINGSANGPTVPITSVSGGGLWSAGSTWDLGHIPNASNGDVTIISNLASPVVVNDNLTLNHNVTINTGAALTVNSGKTVDVNGKILTVKTDASLLNNGIITGDVKVERLITGDKWHLLSSPVVGTTSNLFSLALNSNIPIYLRQHNETTNSWAYITDLVTSIVPTIGYAIWADGGTPNINYTGALNTDASIPFTKNGLGWNLMGNPYTSALDWNAVTGKNFAGGAFYCWNADAGKYSVSDGYANVNQLNITAPYIIPAMQGFFVRALGVGSINISGAKIHSAQAYYKSSNSLNEMVRLTAQRGAFKDEVLVIYNSAATNNYDEAYDASKFFANNNDIPEIYTLAGTEEIAINKIGSIPAVVPMNIKLGVADNVTISASDYASFDASVYIILEDMLTGTFQNLRQNPSYTFAANVGDNAGRFNLHFSYSALAINENQNANTSIYSYNNTIYVNSSEKINEISVYNMLGQLVINKAGNANALNTISIQGAYACYIVKVTTDNGVYTEKVFVK